MQDVCLLAGVIDGKGRHIAQLEDLGIYIYIRDYIHCSSAFRLRILSAAILGLISKPMVPIPTDS